MTIFKKAYRTSYDITPTPFYTRLDCFIARMWLQKLAAEKRLLFDKGVNRPHDIMF